MPTDMDSMRQLHAALTAHLRAGAVRHAVVAMKPGRLTDGCPECGTRAVPLHHWVEGDTVTGRYHCRRCGHAWRCTWSVAALGFREDEAPHRNDPR